MIVRQITRLRAALGDYARTPPLQTKAITSPIVQQKLVPRSRTPGGEPDRELRVQKRH